MGVHRRSGCGWKELFRSYKMSTRASKTEFVCKSYSLAKFAVKTGQKSGRVGHGNGNWRKQTISSDETADFEVGLRPRVGAAGNGDFLCRGRPTTRTLRKRPKTSQNERKTGRFRPEVGHGCRGRENRLFLPR